MERLCKYQAKTTTKFFLLLSRATATGPFIENYLIWSLLTAGTPPCGPEAETANR